LLKIFIGYDPRESLAYHTLCNSILRQASTPVSITPLYLPNLSGIFNRPTDDRQSNSFSYSRFLIPHLCNYEGYALYLDCDMLMRGDVTEVFDKYCNDNMAVSVVKHDYTSSVSIKYLGNKQFNYPRKNWSSFVLWNCSHASNKQVNPHFVETAEPATLHRFLWLADSEIGEINKKWNWLVGEYENPPKDILNVHWTLGGPYFSEYQDTDFAAEWFEEQSLMINCDQLKER
jgi:lipopolysaccharide biosynthesis glycosyltransferase